MSKIHWIPLIWSSVFSVLWSIYCLVLNKIYTIDYFGNMVILALWSIFAWSHLTPKINLTSVRINIHGKCPIFAPTNKYSWDSLLCLVTKTNKWHPSCKGIRTRSQSSRLALNRRANFHVFLIRVPRSLPSPQIVNLFMRACNKHWWRRRQFLRGEKEGKGRTGKISLASRLGCWPVSHSFNRTLVFSLEVLPNLCRIIDRPSDRIEVQHRQNLHRIG